LLLFCYFLKIDDHQSQDGCLGAFCSLKRYWVAIVFNRTLSNCVQSNDKSNCKIRYRYQKNSNYVTITVIKKKSNSVISKVTKKVTCNLQETRNLLLFSVFTCLIYSHVQLEFAFLNLFASLIDRQVFNW